MNMHFCIWLLYLVTYIQCLNFYDNYLTWIVFERNILTFASHINNKLNTQHHKKQFWLFLPNLSYSSLFPLLISLNNIFIIDKIIYHWDYDFRPIIYKANMVGTLYAFHVLQNSSNERRSECSIMFILLY